jgi:hypothetical protein
MANNNKVNREQLIDGFDAYEAVLDTPTNYGNGSYSSYEQAIDAYNESREEVFYD